MPDHVQSSLTHVQKRKLLKFFEPSIRQHPEWPVVISEGDSWFSFPLHANTIDFLDQFARRKLSLLRLEKSGDEFLTIMSGKQRKRLQRYLGRYPVQALLVSGGGNDVVGADLLPLLRQKTGSMGWEACIRKERVNLRIGRLEDAYKELLDLRDDHRPECVVYVHGYDFALPTGKAAKAFPGVTVGPWIQPQMLERGIEDFEDQRKIVRFLVSRFNDVLKDLAEKRDRLVYVKTPGTLADIEWNDELHPSRKGFEKVAKVFRKELKEQFPDTF